MGLLVGPIGLLLATPLLAATLVSVKMLYVEDLLSEEIATPEDHLPAERLPPLPETHRVDEGEKPAPHAGKELAETARAERQA